MGIWVRGCLLFMVAGVYSVQLFAADVENVQEQQKQQQQQNNEVLQAQAIEARRLYQNGEDALRLASANQFYGYAVQSYEAASALGHQGAKARLEWLATYLPNEPSLKSRYRREMVKAKQGDAEAQYVLGHMCEFGVGVEKNFERALRWYQEAAANDHGKAQNRLGELYAAQEQQGEAQEQEQALSWIQSAAENNQRDAQFKLGNYYLEGQHFDKNEQKALEWFKRAAESGHIQAQVKVGFMLKEGQGTKQNYEAALLWFEKAAQQGNTVAGEQVKEVNRILDEIFLKTFK